MSREATTYHSVKRVIDLSFSKEEVDGWLAKPVDTHPIFDIIHKASEMISKNRSYVFPPYEDMDIYQKCWEWAYGVLDPMQNIDQKTKKPKEKAKYNYKTSLFGYLNVVFINKMYKLRRDKQWRNDISDQKACKECAVRETCTRKVYFSERDDKHTCPIIIKAIERNELKATLNSQMDDEITERPSPITSVEQEAIGNDICDELFECLPEKWKQELSDLVNGHQGVKKHSIKWIKAWCRKVLREKVHDDMEAEKFKKVLWNYYIQEYRKRLRTKQKADKKKIQKVHQQFEIKLILPEDD